LGFVGKAVDVRADLLLGLCAEGVVPVISPISAGPEGRYNVNADHAAGAIAGAIHAAKVIFLTNVSGVQANGKLAERLTAAETHQLIADQIITGGMIPKVNAALEALESGAAEVVITDLAGLHAGSGTAFIS
jgi:acetylglutamate kinase